MVALELGIPIGIAIVLVWLIVIPWLTRPRVIDDAPDGPSAVAEPEIACVACGRFFGTQEAVAEHISRDHGSG